ncbi:MULTISPECIES: GntR family transcriptional regulator [Pseudomonas]|uniref:GntR family transcriptional regulator n=2 Tax=Pseudomonadaceae TaxID=135621 RepID=A0A0D0KLP3_9PSED|nr:MULTISPECIES: GntR family transcriptional regulator [Pseudomonas]KIQ00413.1 GntR family transcriptional regulator [Pseudomonas fulva]MCW2291268.1 DNA-binding GntR family transcriptional regulator [Pseudomonas sp. BIGb0408]NYH74161.1 DNA-binding GntR family transcriptional regulator [Pseudomonas flavescens]
MTTDLTNSQRKALREIISYVRREQLAPGAHLPEWTLAKLIGTSRSPVKIALECLVGVGFMRYDRNRGYHLEGEIDSLPSEVLDLLGEGDDPMYLRLAEARFDGLLPDSVTEADLVRLLNATRSEVSKALGRAQSEGWVEKEVGYGWRFLPMIDSLEAYDDMYSLRIAIEPAGILSPKFRPDLEELQMLRQEQMSILNGGYKTMTSIDRFESNARLHETIAKWSGNRFSLQTLRRLDQMRRLVEYRQARHELPRQELAQEHIHILDAISQGDNLYAASLMRQHIEDARRKKAVSKVFEHPIKSDHPASG